MPIIEISSVSEELLTQFREQFGKFEGEELDPSTNLPKRFYQQDIEDLNSNDVTAKYYLTHAELKLEEAVKVTTTSFEWRKQYGVRDIDFDSFPEYVKDSEAMSIHGTDKDGRRVLWLYMTRVKRSKTDLDVWCRYLVYHLESVYKQRGTGRLVFVIDLTAVGLTSFDYDLTGFAIKLFENYYPDLLTFQINFNMAWTLKTAWNIIKTWMSAEAIARVKFVKGNDLQQYICSEFIPHHMGGTYK